LNVKALDLRGFVDLRSLSQSMWNYFPLRDLKELTLETASSLLEDPGDVWSMLTAANARLTCLKTNLVSMSLVTFISSFSGLEILCLTPCLQPQSAHVIPPCLAVVTNLHSYSLRVLSIQIRNENGEIYLLDQKCLELISVRCTRLEELGFGILTHNMNNMDHVFQIPFLRVLHIQTFTSPAGHAIERNGNDLRDRVSKYLSRGCAPHIKYVAFDTGPVYSLERNPVKWSIMSQSIGYNHDTIIFRERLLDWVISYPY
jgi:hypothetical protein